MREMLALRDQYDPHGGRAMGSRGMLDVAEAEYGGEMLYINKSQTKPVWMMEYCRDEGVRGYFRVLRKRSEQSSRRSFRAHIERDGSLMVQVARHQKNHPFCRYVYTAGGNLKEQV